MTWNPFAPNEIERAKSEILQDLEYLAEVDL